ncbi:uncharacterized protein LOC135346641 [Halichondria panicea]|uniref:uncharacterized protein LOC135346641 n=1 Tax=Halichondria panicea TaxID=6063 RepID=UPI00312B9681
MVNPINFNKLVVLFVLLVITVYIWYFQYLHSKADMNEQATTEQVNAIEKKLTSVVPTNDIEHSKKVPTEQVKAIQTKLSTVVAPTRFIYLTQTENCIPTYLKSPKVIGDSEACQCDVIILSYKTKCADTSLPHVQYIFNSSKTWTTGRNLLYKTAKERKEKYIHYIFMDDDVRLIPVDKRSTQNPFRMYEKSLKTFQPAVVIILDDSGRCKFPKKIISERSNCEVTGYLQIYRIDGLFIAYHYQVIDFILPYEPRYDSVSWWYSQEYTNVVLNIRLNGQVVTDPRFITPNPKHRSYVQKYPGQDAFNQFVADIRSEEPEKYRNSVEPILQQWLTLNINSKFLLGQQTCKRDLSVHPYRPYENLT